MKAIDRAWRGAKSEWRTHAVSALSSAVAFLCLAFALLMVTNLQRVEERWNSVGQVSVYLTPGATDQAVAEVVRALRATQGVVKADHVPAESARSQMLEASPSSLLEALPSAAFPDSIEVQLATGIPKARTTQMVRQLKALPSVESIETYSTWTARVSKFAHAANVVALCLTLIVFFAVATVVSSTTKLMLERRRDEVEVLRTVGATTDYVRRPFLLEGAVQGTLGAIGALLLCGVVFSFLSSRFDGELRLLLGVEPHFLPASMSAGLLLTGAVLGCGAAYFSLRKAFSA